MLLRHTNYRDWLNAEISERKQANPSYSESAFAKKLGISQPYLSLLLSGRRKLSLKQANKLATALDTTETEEKYLQLLVRFDRSEDKEEKALLEAAMNATKQAANVTELSLALFEVISDWKFSAILEALSLNQLTSIKDICEYLNIEQSEGKKCLKKLHSLELVKKEGSRYVRCQPNALFTPNDIKSNALKRFHTQSLDMAKTALHKQEPSERSISGVTMAIDPAKLPEAKQRIDAFHKDLMNLLESGNPSKVYQLSTQLFEFTAPKETP